MQETITELDPQISDVQSLLLSIMSVDSTTGSEEKMACLLGLWLEKRGWTVTLQTVNLNGQLNIFAHKGEKGHSPKLIFNSHLDTVPPYIPPRLDEEKGVIHGRGSCDAKGQVAAQIFAAEDLLREGYDVGLLFVAEEETMHSGMIKANDLGLKPQFLIVGEPTESKIVKQQKGVCSLTLKSHGVAAHSGYPDTGKSAIEPLVDVLHDLKNYQWPKNDLGATTLNIGVITGGRARNIVPEYAEAKLMFRLINPPDTIHPIIEKIVNQRVQINWDLENDPVILNTIPGIESTTVSFNTDVAYFKFDGKAYLFGAGSILDAHTSHEHITVTELKAAIETYKRIAKYLLDN